MRILQVSTTDRVGGAAGVCWELHAAWKARGHESWIATAVKASDDPDVFLLSPEGARSGSARRLGRESGLGPLARLRRRIGLALGHEDFAFPATAGLLDLPPRRPDLLHGHNLHGGYFDLRALPGLSARLPVALTLHDSWLLGGHCAHPLGCGRWETGCGDCPDLAIYPPVRRDATAANFRRKKALFAKSRLHVATPCAWLMDRVGRSMLAPAAASARVIPCGVSPELFRPGDKALARHRLGLPREAVVLLFSSFMVRNNPFRDFELLRGALMGLTRSWCGAPLVLVALGGEGETERHGRAEIRFLPFTDDRGLVAELNRAADLYLHAAKMDTFPTAVLEALASGTPVAATAAGGIPEQVRSLDTGRGGPHDTAGPDRATGILTPVGDLEAFRRGLSLLAGDATLLARLGENARRDALERFTLERQADAYEAWFREILDTTRGGGHA